MRTGSWWGGGQGDGGRAGLAWRERRSVIIELGPGLGLDDPEVPPAEVVTGHQPWEWAVDLDLVGERLHHGIWANSVDARAGAQLATWRWADVALTLGGGAPNATDGADIVLADGRPAVCDGGPLDASLGGRLGMAVVHRISLEHGMLVALGPNDPVGVPLAADQLQAVAAPGAGARIIAPAGSGKTRVLTERARLLLRGWGLPPDAVALVAYNVRAANEMRERLADVGDVRIRTLNALGLRLCGRTFDDRGVGCAPAPRWPGHVFQAGRDRPGGAVDRSAQSGAARTGRPGHGRG